jgi:hypothetical protein
MPRLRDVLPLLFMAGPVIPACGNTTGPPPPPPPPPAVSLTARHGHAIAYDEARHQLLLFGGTGAEGTEPVGDRNSTWTWNGTMWTRLSTSGPSPRYLASLVYDAARQRVVLYGGEAGVFPNITVLSDTWEWDGTTWTQRATIGPSTRVHKAMAYDRARGRAVLYGGFNDAQGEIRDVWEWDGAAWTQRATNMNVVAVGAGYDEKAAVLYLYSVLPGTQTVVTDSWDGTTLTRTALAGPGCVPPHPQLVALGPTRGGLLFYAGTCGPAFNTPETWRWDGASWAKVTGSQPDLRTNAAMAYDRDRDRVVLFGGEVTQGAPDLGDTWEFDGTTWIKK